jgi:hypothetical protein
MICLLETQFHFGSIWIATIFGNLYFLKKSNNVFQIFWRFFFCLLYVIHFLCTCDLYVIFILFLPPTQNRINFEITYFQKSENADYNLVRRKIVKNSTQTVSAL